MASKETIITLPHLFTPRWYQQELMDAIDNGYKRLIYVAHRRAGKDKTIWNIMIKEAFKRIGTYFYILPTYSQAKMVIWDNIDNDGFRMMDHLPKKIVKKMNETETQIELINGSIIKLVGVDNIDRIVGTNPVGVVFSEYSLCKAEVWGFISPILAANGGWAIFNFTPRGTNHAYALLQQAKADPENWYVGIFPVSVTKAIPDKTLAQERRERTQAMYEQEYECKFLDGASQFFKNIESCTYGEEIQRSLPMEGDFKLGVDLAKYNDFTVLTPFNLNTFVVYPQERFNQIDWVLQEAKIEACARRYNNARVTIDSTGIGDPVVENLTRKGLNIGEEDSIKFSYNLRKNMLTNLAIMFEQNQIKIPNDEGLIAELKSFTMERNDTGKEIIKAPDGLHDDRVFSLALAVWGAGEKEPLDPLNRNQAYIGLQKRDKSAKVWI